MKKKHKYIKYFSIFFIIIACVGIVAYINKPKKDTLYIAVVGPMKGFKSNGQAMLEGIQTCIENAKTSGLLNKNIELLIYDDVNTPENAKKVAQNIIKDNKAIMVLGHYYSTSSLSAGKLYQQAHIPALTGSATADNVVINNDWYFRIISNNSIQGAFAAYYLNKVLKKNVVNIIYDTDDYGRNLMEQFENTAQRIGVKTRKWGITSQNFDDKVDTIVSQIRDIGLSGAIFLATHATEGARLVSLLKYPGAKFTILGPDAFCSESFIATLNNESFQERAEPGYHSEGIYVISPFIIDIANQSAQVFRKGFKETYKHEPTWVNAYYYDAMLTAIHAINHCNADENNNIADVREAIRDYFASLNSYEAGIHGITGRIYFDENGENPRPFAVGMFTSQKITSAFVQYQPIEEMGNATSVLSDMLTGKIIKINNAYMCQTRVVYTGLDVNDVIELDLENHSYIVDFYLWFRYQTDFDEATGIRFVNSVGSLYLDDKLTAKDKAAIAQVLHKSENGITTKAYHVTARFRNSFDFHEYPFEQHDLRVKFRHANLTRNQIIYVSDILGMHHFSDQFKHVKIKYTGLNAWNVKRQLFYQNVITNDSTLGYPKYFKSKNLVEYSEFNTDITIKRKIFSFLFKNVFLIIVLVTILNFIYFIPPNQFSIKITISMSTLLTTSLCHTKMANNMNVGYLLTIEYAFFAVYAIAAVCILLSIWLFNLFQQSELEGISEDLRNECLKKIRRINLFGVIFHLFIGIISGVVLYLNL